MARDPDQFLYDYDALAEVGLAEDPDAWADLAEVDQALAALKRRRDSDLLSG